MADEKTNPRDDDSRDFLDSEEARENARRIEEQRLQLIEERWLSTHVLAVHLEIESMLGAMLRQTLRDRHLEALGLLRGVVEVRKRHARQRFAHGALDRAEIVLLLR